MEISRVTCLTCGDKLFSFYRHDYKTCSCETSFIDGGFDYTRFSGELNNVKIKDAIKDIREQFKWTARLTRGGKLRKVPKVMLLKNIKNEHLASILEHFSNKENPIWEIFNAELNYRNEIRNNRRG